MDYKLNKLEEMNIGPKLMKLMYHIEPNYGNVGSHGKKPRAGEQIQVMMGSERG